MPEITHQSTAAETAEQFAALVADLPDLDVPATDDEFPCVYCGGKLEASAPLWFNVHRRPDGTATVDVYGVGVEASTVSCADCGRDASIEQDRLITDAMCPFDAALTGMEV
ncbi:hypothetical protein [Kitasatospora purpeofusca]|uniref:hypothetical protein n=1 Tax=Kitasatospora purpeofusca TaxID=67352 RepID=UPI00324EB5F6|nr:hypothetical protein OIP63_05785 [Kitasatospora purpeofusca]